MKSRIWVIVLGILIASTAFCFANDDIGEFTVSRGGDTSFDYNFVMYEGDSYAFQVTVNSTQLNPNNSCTILYCWSGGFEYSDLVNCSVAQTSSYSITKNAGSSVCSFVITASRDLTLSFNTGNRYIGLHCSYQNENYIEPVYNSFVFNVPAGYVLSVTSEDSFIIDDMQVQASSDAVMPVSNFESGFNNKYSNGTKYGFNKSSEFLAGVSVDSLLETRLLFDAKNMNVLGQASEFFATLVDTETSDFDMMNPFYFVRPVDFSYNVNQNGSLVCDALIKYTTPLTFTIRSMTSVKDNSIIQSNFDNVITDPVKQYYGVQNNGGNGVINVSWSASAPDSGSSGQEPVVPPSGGGNSDDYPITDNGQDGFIRSLLNRIISLLESPINAIKTLVNAGSNFFEWMEGLFTWLPDPVETVVISSLMVVCIIGVLKVFL